MKLAKPTDKCECGHTLENHIIDIKKSMKSKYVKAKCRICNCTDLTMQ